jgi:DEAD/DEAH box helicase domain-containing protein
VLERFEGASPARQRAARRGARGAAGVRLQEDPYYTHENIGYGPVTLPTRNCTPRGLVAAAAGRARARVRSRQQALDGFLGAAYACTSSPRWR